MEEEDEAAVDEVIELRGQLEEEETEHPEAEEVPHLCLPLLLVLPLAAVEGLTNLHLAWVLLLCHLHAPSLMR